MKPDLSQYDAYWTARSSPLVADGRLDAERLSGPPARLRRRRGPADVRLVRRFDWSAASIFAAWVDPAIAGKWLFATAVRPLASARIDGRAGGSFRLREQREGRMVEHCGSYVAFLPPCHLAFTLSTPDHPADTRIDVDIASRPRGCMLTLLHANIDPDHAQRIRQRWIGMLYGLDATLRAGVSGHAARTAQDPER
jgi:uncharacterized protein YndB with AHSA1/START domain